MIYLWIQLSELINCVCLVYCVPMVPFFFFFIFKKKEQTKKNTRMIPKEEEEEKEF